MCCFFFFVFQDVSTSQSFLNPSSSSPTINSYNLNAQNSGIDTKPITVNQADLKKQQLEFLEAQMLQADAEAKKRQAEVQKRLAEAKKMAEKLAEEERFASTSFLMLRFYSSLLPVDIIKDICDHTSF